MSRGVAITYLSITKVLLPIGINIDNTEKLQKFLSLFLMFCFHKIDHRNLKSKNEHF